MKKLPAIVVAFVTIACSTESSGGPGGSCAAFVQAQRDGAKSCGHLNLPPEREDEYFQRLQTLCENEVNAPGSGLTSGVLDQCVSRLREYCGDPEACGGLTSDLKGSLADGAACQDDYQCSSGNCFNDDTPSQTSTGCGTCVAALKIGDPCPNGGCPASSTCFTTSSSSGPSTSKCVALRRVGEGQACGGESPSTIPDEVVRCEFPLDCVHEGTTSGSAGVCRSLGSEGDACGEKGGGRNCKPGLVCVQGRCGQRVAAGGACEGSNDCAAGLGCDSSHKCATITWGAAGATCDQFTKRCSRGFCKMSSPSSNLGTGVCVDYLADGAACDPTKPEEQRCDVLSRCMSGTCQLENPALCK